MSGKLISDDSFLTVPAESEQIEKRKWFKIRTGGTL